MPYCLKSSIQAQNSRIYCGFYFCFLQISLKYCMQSYTLADVHDKALFTTIAAHTLISIIKIHLCLNLSILSLLYPDLRYPARYSQLFKDSFNVRPTSHQLHLWVKSPNLATTTTRTSSPSLPTHVFSVPSIKLKN